MVVGDGVAVAERAPGSCPNVTWQGGPASEIGDAHLPQRRTWREPSNADETGEGAEQADEQAQQCGLAGAIRPDHAEAAPASQIECDAVKHELSTVPDGHAPH